MTRVEPLRKLLAAADRVSRDESLATRLVESTGLSRENVMLGLTRHLETRATDAELEALVATVSLTSRVHVILSPSVFVAPLRALALALAASDRVTLKPSRREPHFARALVDAFGDPRVTLASVATVEDVSEGEVHVYGRDDTIARVRLHAAPGVIVRAHGNGMGVALVTGDLASAASALADDVIAFDQRGCLSPRVAFVVGDAQAFGRLLFDALESAATRVPRGTLDPGETQDFAWWASTLEYAGRLHRGVSCAVGVLSERVYPPSGRHILVHELASPTDLPRVLDDDARFVITVGTSAPDLARAVAPAHARISLLGSMQRPPLDGPVDRRES